MNMKLKGQTGWGAVESALCDARGIAFDTCHKIYILMDEEQMELMRQYEYDPLLSASDLDSYAMLEQVKSWYEQSCGLRFVNAVYTNHENPNDGFCDLIPQGFGEDEEY
jgi:hypothetical protein